MISSHHFYSRICGKLLGDGCITKQLNRKPRFQFIHRATDEDWAYYCYLQLKEFLPLSPPVYRKIADTRLIKGYSENFTVQSRTHPVITDLYQLWYPAGKKELPFPFIEQYLNEEALSWWYQDDGHLKVVNGKMTKIILSTDSFSAEENRQLIALLFTKFNLRFTTDKQNRLILYDQFQIIYFLRLVSPWLNSAMQRKAMIELPLRPIAHRTTIYLPDSIKLEKPTAEINAQLKQLNRLLCPEGKIHFHSSVFKEFQKVNLEPSDSIAYQIVIQEKHRLILAQLRQQTGLTVSQLVEYCFKTKIPAV